tara:strand:- start:2975 stop:3520 length:546 start_codon:yes stop_codon:yes gene_type:complete
MEDTQSTQLRDMDDYLKQMIVQHWDKAIQSIINQNQKVAFLSFKSLFHIIEPYDFSTKDYLTNLTHAIEQHLDALGDRPLTERDLISFNQQSLTVRELMNSYQSKIPEAYKELNLWLRTTPSYQDIQEQLAVETFGSELKTLEKKKKELLKNLDINQALELMNKNHIHDLYWRYRYNDIPK